MALMFMPRMLTNNIPRNGVVVSQAYKFVRIQSANITSKENRDPTVTKPAPWPYKTKKFTLLRSYFESTTKRFDENSKIVVVDGNIAAGKSSFAKQLADAFDMVYFPEPTMDRYCITEYGYDLRQINDLFPPSYKICDINTFYKNPHHQNVSKFQFRMFMFRLEDYIDALAHLLNTGQGVVMERSVYGDFIFMETLVKFGYSTPQVLNLYKDIRRNTLEELMRPHLVIYLDVPPEVALERIKKRNNPAEVNSKVLTKDYLETIEYFYKQRYLKQMKKHAEILVYNWSNFGDIETVVEDIERIDFDRFSNYDSQMSDWRKEDEWEWNEVRRYYTNERCQILDLAYIRRPSVPEVHHPGEEVEEFKEIISKVPGEKFAEGFNPDCGESYLFKLNQKSYWYLGRGSYY